MNANFGSVNRHALLLETNLEQAGIVSRAQLLGSGWTSGMIRSQLHSFRWRVVLPGIYATTTGELSPKAWRWVGHLHAGNESAVAGLSALQAMGLEPFSLPVEVHVPRRCSVRDSCDVVEVKRKSSLGLVRVREGEPPIVQAADAVLDHVDSLDSSAAVMDWITKACQRHATTADKLAVALAARTRHRHRQLVLELISAMRDGATSVLEVDGVRRILRNHELPLGRGQVREYQSGAVVFRDRLIDPPGLVLEFDGRLGHADSGSRFRDGRRDNAVMLSGRVTLRLGWQDVHEDACDSAVMVEAMLIRCGWLGNATACGPSCSIAQR